LAYLNERRGMFGRIDGPLFRSASHRNYGRPLGPSTWSKTAEASVQVPGAVRPARRRRGRSARRRARSGRPTEPPTDHKIIPWRVYGHLGWTPSHF
jgi:hypothetical protein